ncbi:MAG: undecaprenyldiphospho-muramoylpentapeptide beta-N-acetylglucosaminyltransferase [Actinomycetota bacterium]|nr:undecaprenyldiphospho-muramoylpentapeptide beta-N-acetylglucosaminyltransferase [Actinomycetota bacterium]
MRTVIAGGGTAGHVFPAIALADVLRRDHGATVSFIGSAQGQEAALVPAAGYGFHPVEAAQLVREVSLRAAIAPLIALRSVRASRPFVEGADVLVGMGGYVSAPAVLAARRARVPVVLHEANAVPGLANRLLSRGARSVGVAFEDATRRFSGHVPIVVTGNPVRDLIREVPSKREALAAEAVVALGLEAGRATVVVFGGSQGALHLDRAVATAIAVPALRDRGDLQLIVLTGPAHLEEMAGASSSAPVRVRAFPFLERIDLACAVADVAVSRAGAGHIAELTVCGIPSILVPYPHATENHQEANARELVRAGAADLVLDRDLTGEVLARRILELVDDLVRRRSMSNRAAAWAKPDAAERLAELVMRAGTR